MTSGWLVDTNVISEFSKEMDADAAVWSWFESTPEDELYLSVVTLGEIAKGIALGEARGRDMRLHRRFLEREIPDRFGRRILDFNAAAAIAWGQLMAALRVDRNEERRLAVYGQIAATAATRALGVCSRNVRDFERLGVAPIVNPFVAR